jgi:hypothetical protein
MAAERPENAVITAQTAVEVCAHRCFELLLRLEVDRDEVWVAIVECVPDASFMDKKTRMLWQGLTGDRISGASSWKAYQQHVERRNAAVHLGGTVPQIGRRGVDSGEPVDDRAHAEHGRSDNRRVIRAGSMTV